MDPNWDYDGLTRNHYRDAETAAAYHRRFTDRRVRHFRQAFVAQRERVTLDRMLTLPSGSTVLDLPCGTGKMAPVFQRHGYQVISADISEEMLAIAKEEYRLREYSDVQFVRTDAESAPAALSGKAIDAVVCIRLMHRVPANVRAEILEAFAQIAPLSLISYGVYTPVQRFRKRLHATWKMVRGKPRIVTARPNLKQIEGELCAYFTIDACLPIARGLSSERIFRLRSRAFSAL